MMFDGRLISAEEMAAFTSWAAASMLRSRENWIVTDVELWGLDDVILSMPAMVENERWSGVATVAAIVSGLAPGRLAYTEIVGKSTVGRSLTDSLVYEMEPKKNTPSMTSVVMTGRRMNSPVKFISARLGAGASVAHGRDRGGRAQRRPRGGGRRAAGGELAGHPALKLVEVRVEDRGHVQCHDLREGQASHHRNAERPPRCARGADADRDGQRACDRRHRRHHDGAKADARRLENRLLRRCVLRPFRGDREVDHHDRV